jgi:secondary thiamine-phosphate synthase enzyme
MKTVQIRTQRKDEITDITETVAEYVRNAKNESGICTLFVTHTTCSITTADLDPGTDLDFLDALRSILPDLNYRHPHNPEHTPDHIISSLIGPSLVIPYANRRLLLGIWQRIVLVELDGPRQRAVQITCL